MIKKLLERYTLDKVIKLIENAGKKGNPLKAHSDDFRYYIAKGELLKELRSWKK